MFWRHLFFRISANALLCLDAVLETLPADPGMYSETFHNRTGSGNAYGGEASNAYVGQ